MGMGMGMGRRAGGRSSRALRRAFSLIERVVVIGIVLIGLLMPALASAREQAVQTRNLAAIRFDMQLLTHYTNDHSDLFPIGWDNPVVAAMLWYRPLVHAGYAESWRDLGIPNSDEDRSLTALTLTAIEDQSVFQPGASRHENEEPLVSQRATGVRFPSEKGILWQYRDGGLRTGDAEWCCLPFAPVVPFAFADGSATARTYRDFHVQPEPALYLQVGIPVQSTWHGLAGRDMVAK
ncbi:MAG: type II secretion system GspH family protein [Phycisphaerales bacterium]|nr:type II secretion system GspH family protein [Phycisphaerales bacterium]